MLILLFGLLTLVAGVIWLLFDKPSLEPVTVVLGGLTALLGAIDRARVSRTLGIILGVVGLGLLVWGIIRAFPVAEPTAESPRDTSECSELIGRGNEAYGKGRYLEALNYYGQALVIARQLGERVGEERVLHGIGKVYYQQGLYDQALASFQQALVIAREVGDRAEEAGILTGIGAVYERRGLYKQALTNCQQALVLFRESGDRLAGTLQSFHGLRQFHPPDVGVSHCSTPTDGVKTL